MTDKQPLLTNVDIKEFLESVPRAPGIYQMLDNENKVLYVGKAKNLSKRLSHYFQTKYIDSKSANKTAVLMAKMHYVTTTITNNETEALLLEQSLIKQLSPPYNIMFRDDKSYPYIYMSNHKDYPLLGFRRLVHRKTNHKKSAEKKLGQYFGPYPNAGSVRESLSILQKTFLLRQCEDSFFKNRSRPCLQYQIKRCSAPCVGIISTEDYAQDVKHAIMFLQGKNNELIDELANLMDDSSTALNFELAAHYRDQITYLRHTQRQQYVVTNDGNADVIACNIDAGIVCIDVLYIRGGRMIGNKNYFPKFQIEITSAEILSAFLAQLYLQWRQASDIPHDIILSQKIDDIEWIKYAIESLCQHKINFIINPRSHKHQWLQLAKKNAAQSLKNYLNNKATLYQRMNELQDIFNLGNKPQRIECFDVSHNAGESTIASCVVFDNNGPVKSDYRRFNIKNITPGDDYAGMEQALTRRYTRLKSNEAKLPDVILIDGGKGQLKQAVHVMEELQISGITLIGIAKGKSRKPGLETCYINDEKTPISMAADSKALHLLQQIRDEAHRFAIAGHRHNQAKQRKQSPLEHILGIGPKRRRNLLRYFGGLDALRNASLEEIAKVPGINHKIASTIYINLHNE